MSASFQNLVTPYTRLSPERCALLVIDVQNDYGDPRGAVPMPGIEEAIPAVVEVIEVFRAARLPVVHVVRLYWEDGSNVDPCRRWQVEQGELRAVAPGSWGAQLVPSTNPTGADLDAERLLAGGFQELAPLEYAMYKPRFSAFHDTPLHAFLQEKGVDSVVIVGLTFPNCVRATQFGATDLDYRVGVVPGACTEVHEEGLRAMQRVGVQLLTLEGLSALVQVGGSGS